MMLKIAGVVLCEVTVYVLLKQYKPEFALLSEAVSIIIILFMLTDEIKEAISLFGTYFGFLSKAEEYISVMLKILGISLVTQFTSDMCRDSGESALASKVEFAGKIIIIAASLPVIEGFTGLITRMVENV